VTGWPIETEFHSNGRAYWIATQGRMRAIELGNGIQTTNKDSMNIPRLSTYWVNFDTSGDQNRKQRRLTEA
jgi:hypothetical protein